MYFDIQCLSDLNCVVLKTGLTPSASGSAYFELEPSFKTSASDGVPRVGGLKLACTVHGPRPLPRSAPFTPQLLLSCRIKFAPFAARDRRGYVPDSNERSLAAHLETALRGSLIGDRWPKSGLDVVITVLEGEEDSFSKSNWRKAETCSMMSILSGCITVASAAIADAGIDGLDVVTGGTAAAVRKPDGSIEIVLDPCPADHFNIESACAVGYLQSRDEISEIWANGNLNHSSNPSSHENIGDEIMDMAAEAALASRLVLLEALGEAAERKMKEARGIPVE